MRLLELVSFRCASTHCFARCVITAYVFAIATAEQTTTTCSSQVRLLGSDCKGTAGEQRTDCHHNAKGRWQLVHGGEHGRYKEWYYPHKLRRGQFCVHLQINRCWTPPNIVFRDWSVERQLKGNRRQKLIGGLFKVMQTQTLKSYVLALGYLRMKMIICRLFRSRSYFTRAGYVRPRLTDHYFRQLCDVVCVLLRRFG